MRTAAWVENPVTQSYKRQIVIWALGRRPARGRTFARASSLPTKGQDGLWSGG